MKPREIHKTPLTLQRAVESNPNEVRKLLLQDLMYSHAMRGEIMPTMVSAAADDA